MFKKFLSLLKVYRAQIISMIIMSVLAIGVYVGFCGEWYTIKSITNNQYKVNNFPEYQISINEGFLAEETKFLDNISDIEYNLEFDFITETLDGSANNVAVTVLSEYSLNTFSKVKGNDFTSSSYGIYLNDKFMKNNNLTIGDNIKLKYANINIDLKILSSIKAANYYIPIKPSSKQIMPNFKTYGYSYISYETYKAILDTYNLDVSYNKININTKMSSSKLEALFENNLSKTATITSKENNTMYKAAMGEVEEGKLCANIISIIFVVIVLLSLTTLFQRISKKERTEIATFKALGFKNKKICLIYTLIGVFIGVISSIFGTGLGLFVTYFIMNKNGAMSTYIDPISWKLSYPFYTFIAVFIYIILLGVISYLFIRIPLKEKACNLFKRETPKNYKPIFVEKFSFFQKLKFSTRWNIRDVFRHKSRTLLQIFGIFASVVLLFYTFGMKDTINNLVDSYNDAYNYNTKVHISSNANDNEIEKLIQDLEADASSTMYVSLDNTYYQLTVYDSKFNHIKLLNKKQKPFTLKDEGAYVCYRLYDKGYKVGDLITISTNGKTYSMPIVGVYRTFGSEGISISDEYAKKINLDYKYDSLYTPFEAKDINTSIVLETETKQGVIDSLLQMLNVLDQMIILVVIAAVIVGVVVLYTISSMSFLERQRDLATLKVLGFKDKTLKRITNKLNLYLTIIGIIISLPISYATLVIIMKKIGDDFEMIATPKVLTYLTSILITFITSIFVEYISLRKNKNISMVEALKNGE